MQMTYMVLPLDPARQSPEHAYFIAAGGDRVAARAAITAATALQERGIQCANVYVEAASLEKKALQQQSLLTLSEIEALLAERGFSRTKGQHCNIIKGLVGRGVVTPNVSGRAHRNAALYDRSRVREFACFIRTLELSISTTETQEWLLPQIRNHATKALPKEVDLLSPNGDRIMLNMGTMEGY